jgi:hypothetical protein
VVRGDPLVAHGDLELFLTGWYRAALAERPEDVCRAAKVDKREPAPGDPFPDVLVVIRDDSGPELSIVTAERQVGISVICKRERDAVELAKVVHALRSQIAAVEPGNPVAVVTGSNGPYEVPEPQPRFRRYMTVTLVVVASPL